MLGHWLAPIGATYLFAKSDDELDDELDEDDDEVDESL